MTSTAVELPASGTLIQSQNVLSNLEIFLKEELWLSFSVMLLILQLCFLVIPICFVFWMVALSFEQSLQHQHQVHSFWFRQLLMLMMLMMLLTLTMLKQRAAGGAECALILTPLGRNFGHQVATPPFLWPEFCTQEDILHREFRICKFGDTFKQFYKNSIRI